MVSRRVEVTVLMEVDFDGVDPVEAARVAVSAALGLARRQARQDTWPSGVRWAPFPWRGVLRARMGASTIPVFYGPVTAREAVEG